MPTSHAPLDRLAFSLSRCPRIRSRRTLLLPPSPHLANDGLGLTLVRTPAGHYDRGGTGRNQVEARVVVEHVERHLREHPEQSLGIACFSVAQRDAIEDALYAAGVTSAAERS